MIFTRRKKELISINRDFCDQYYKDYYLFLLVINEIHTLYIIISV